MPEALRGLRRVSRRQEAVSEGHKRNCGRRYETLGAFEAAKSQFRRVIKRQCGQSTRCLRRDRAEAISEAFLRLWGGAGGAATPKRGFKVSGCQKSVSEDHKNGVWPRHKDRAPPVMAWVSEETFQSSLWGIAWRRCKARQSSRCCKDGNGKAPHPRWSQAPPCQSYS